MPVTLEHDCPHCHIVRVGWTYRSEYNVFERNRSIPTYFITFSCNSCREAMIVKVRPSSQVASFSDLQGSLLEQRVVNPQTVTFYPMEQSPDIPDDLPEEVGRLYLKAKNNHAKNDAETAGIYYRKSLDVATKLLDPSGPKNLFQRIERLKENRVIHPDLAAWAHSIRSLGADAAHESEAIPDAEVEDMASFSHALYLYIFTVPALLEEHRKRKPPTVKLSQPARPAI